MKKEKRRRRLEAEKQKEIIGKVLKSEAGLVLSLPKIVQKTIQFTHILRIDIDKS